MSKPQVTVEEIKAWLERNPWVHQATEVYGPWLTALSVFGYLAREFGVTAEDCQERLSPALDELAAERVKLPDNIETVLTELEASR